MSRPILDLDCAMVVAAVFALSTGSASAQTIPTIDTEDATLGSATTSSSGRFHPLVAFDIRNGDFARGDYDDDRADLDRLPVHAQIGLVVELTHRLDGEATSWLLLRSSNGFHAPDDGEVTAPRSWYESNNLAALVFTPTKGLRTAAVYTIKTSPNGVSATTHEASLSLAYAGTDAMGALSPTLVATIRPKGNDGVFTQAGIEPGVALSSRQDGPKLSLPLAVGVGWAGFYGVGSGDRRFLSAGLAIKQPFGLGDTHWSAHLAAVALIRDRRLAALSGPDGETATVVPLVTISVSMAY